MRWFMPLRSLLPDVHACTHTEPVHGSYGRSLFCSKTGEHSASGFCKDWIQFSEPVANICESFPWNPTFGVYFP